MRNCDLWSSDHVTLSGMHPLFPRTLFRDLGGVLEGILNNYSQDLSASLKDSFEIPQGSSQITRYPSEDATENPAMIPRRFRK